MFGLTTLGLIHTAISLVAVVCGFWALARYKEITSQQALGRVYIGATLLTALTALGIFQHGGFGPAHGLAVLTLGALVLGFATVMTGLFGRWSRQLRAVCFSATMLFHLIPAFTETLTRLPATQASFPDAEAPGLRPIFGVLVLLFVAGLMAQLRWLRRQAG
ncbi:MAG: hypothetical protein RIQ60_326 [Pseudomonadota bacterium]